MKVAASAAHLPIPAVATAPARTVEARRTPATRGEMRDAIARALAKTSGGSPSSSLVDTLTAQASLETGSGAQMYNYNFGGIKGASPGGATAVLKTHEVISGKDTVIRDGFRAYASLDEGALDYVKTMQSRFGGAMAPAARGDAAGFAHALKQAGYYTASEADYASGISRLMGASSTSTSTSASASMSPSKALSRALSTQSLARVEDSLDVSQLLNVVAAPAHRPQSDDDRDDS